MSTSEDGKSDSGVPPESGGEEKEHPDAGPAGSGEKAGGGKRRARSKLWTPQGEKTVGGEEAEGELSDEELRARVEAALERITTADVVIDMMVTLSSFAYQRMGIPKEVNARFRDMEQARLAIDCLDALLAVLNDRVPEDRLKSLTGTVDNLKLNFVKES